MAKVKIRLADNIARVIFIEAAATNGATLGTNLFDANGNVLDAAGLAALLGVSTTSGGVTHHRLLQGLTLGDDHPQYTRKDTLTTRGDLYVRSDTTVARFPLGADRQFLRAGVDDPDWETVSPVITLGTDLSGSVTLTDLASGALNATIVNDAVTNAKLRDSVAVSVIGRSAATSGDPADIVSTGDKSVLHQSGTTLSFSTVDATYISDFNEAAQDAVGSMFVDSSEINFTYDDASAQVTADLIAASVVFAKLQNIATSRILGRVSASTGSIEALTGTQATTLLDTFTSLLQGLAPASGGGTLNFLRADGTWTVPAGTAPDVSAATVLTEDDETATFPNSRQLLAGTNITFDDTVTGERTISATGSSGGGYPSALGYAGI